MNSGFIYNPAGYINNFNSLRSVCFWAGIFSLVQSLIWIVLALLGILSYNCVLKVDGTFNYGSLFQVIFLQLYFMGSCDRAIPAYDSSMLYEVETVLTPQNIIVWNSVYLAVAVCWLLSSVFLMTYIKPNQPRTVSVVLWTWIIVTFGICVMDLALGIIFGIDYSRFNRKAYNYNLSSMYAGAINPDAAQLLGGMVVSMSMMILSLKGFVLWIINVGFILHFTIRLVYIGRDNNGTDNLFMPHKTYDDILTTRPPINAYQEEELKSSDNFSAFANGGFEPDSHAQENTAAVINREIIARAARLSTDVALHVKRFRNLDTFHQYPSRSQPEVIMTEQQQTFPAPDYTPPMQRAAQNPNRNQRFQ